MADKATSDDPRTGGISPKQTEDVFGTTGNEPVRTKTADESIGTPVKRYFTKDGTPVEPSTVPPAVTPANLSGFDASKRPDIVEAFEYLDETGGVVTHENRKK